MARLSIAVVIGSLLQFVSSSPALANKRSYHDYAVKEVHSPPRTWSIAGPAPKNHVLNLSVGLKQERFDELERLLYEVSDPNHPRYGQHLSEDQVHELIRPSDDAASGVHSWLYDFGFTDDQLQYSPANDWITFTTTVEAAESLLDTKYYVYEHFDGSTLVRTEAWSLPSNLHSHITTVQPTNSFARLHPRGGPVQEIKKRSASVHVVDQGQPWPPPPSGSPPSNVSTQGPDPAAVAAACNFTAVTPTCLRTLYGTISYQPQVPGKNQMALTNYLEQYCNRSDTSLFLRQFRPEAAPAAYEYTEVSIAGGPVDNGTNTSDQPAIAVEGDLDSETMLGIGWPTPLTTYNTGGRNPEFMPDLYTPDNSDEPYLTWVNYVLAQPSIPQVISTSYGDDEQTTSKSYAQAVCNQFAQFGARGVTIFFASGDAGVGASGYCYSNQDNTTETFLPSFPADCPYVTAVGATTGYPESAAYDLLRSGAIYTSGAGFSNYFDAPDYQKDVVSEYVEGLRDAYEGLYNPKGRAYPDISANGQRYDIVWNGSLARVDGTSASTPATAAIFALVNDALIAEGRPPMGFLNPWLYGGGYKLFTDVTNGSSAGCDTPGFPATEGWDAVTGWGTPYFPRLLKGLGLKDTWSHPGRPSRCKPRAR